MYKVYDFNCKLKIITASFYSINYLYKRKSYDIKRSSRRMYSIIQRPCRGLYLKYRPLNCMDMEHTHRMSRLSIIFKRIQVINIYIFINTVFNKTGRIIRRS